jgi:hypothetical protein
MKTEFNLLFCTSREKLNIGEVLGLYLHLFLGTHFVKS